jgi:hypothetical protein
MSKNKDWLTLNQHGKRCLRAFILAISGTDIMGSQMDYLYNKDLVDYATKFADRKGRHELAGHCLTDLGIATVKHYFKIQIH